MKRLVCWWKGHDTRYYYNVGLFECNRCLTVTNEYGEFVSRPSFDSKPVMKILVIVLVGLSLLVGLYLLGLR